MASRTVQHRRVLALAPQITNVARGICRRSKTFADARDLEQDAYVALLQRADRYDGHESFNTFNYLRMQGAMIDGLRRWDSRHKGGAPRVHWEPLPDNAENRWASPDPSPLTQLLNQDPHRDLHTVLARLPKREQYIIRRYIFEGAKQATVAKELHLSESRIWQVYRATLATLKRQLRAA